MAEDHPTSGGSTSIGGDQVARDKVGGDKFGGDKVAGDKVIYNLPTENALPPEAKKALEEFKRAVHKGDVAGADKALTALRSQQSAIPQLWQHVESAEVVYSILSADAGADLADLFDQIPEDWAAEAAAAFVFVCERLQVFTIRQLREAYKQLRLYQIKDEALLVKVERITQKWVSDQPLKWPIHQLKVPSRFAPFTHGDASNPAELAALFGRSTPGRRAAFWSGHPLFNTLSQARTLQVIYGEEGSGCTALGLALGKYVTGLQLSLYVAGLPDDAWLLEGYAGRLMDVIRYLPARLMLLTTADYKLLAELLCTGLDKQSALDDLRNAQVDPAPGSEPGQAFIRQLVQYIVDADSKAAIRTSWPRVVSALARRLGFEGVRLVIDSADTDPTRLNSDLFARFERWQDSGIVTLLFAPQTIIENLETPYSPLALEWKPDDLREMVNHRYQCAVGPRTQIEKRFDSSETLQYLLDVSYYNPRRFMAFWRMLERARPGKEETFDAALVTMVRSAA